MNCKEVMFLLGLLRWSEYDNLLSNLGQLFKLQISGCVKFYSLGEDLSANKITL